MDRRTVYYGELPREVDWLYPQQYAMTGLGFLAEALVGTAGAFDGFAVAPTFPTSMAVTVGRGSVLQSEQLEGSAWSSLPVDTHQVVKQGILQDATTVTLSPPSTYGFAQNVLIQVQYTDVDDGATVLPYYNANNPSQPFAGPGNNNQAQATNRRGGVAVNAKYGIATASGSQATPAPDAGWLGVAVITLAQGQTTVSAASITPYAAAQRIQAKLLDLPYAVQDNRWKYAVDAGTTGSAIVATLVPAPINCGDGFSVRVKLAHDFVSGATFNCNGFTGSIVHPSGVALANGDAKAGDIVEFTRNSGQWVVGAAASGSGGGGGSSPGAVTVLASNTTYSVPSVAYPTIRSVYAALSGITIAPGVLVTVQVASGYYETVNGTTGSLDLSHPDGHQIQIIGAAPSSYPTGATALTYTTAATLSTYLQSTFTSGFNCTGGAYVYLGSGTLSLKNMLIFGDRTSQFGIVSNTPNDTNSLTVPYGSAAGAGGGTLYMDTCWVHNFGGDGISIGNYQFFGKNVSSSFNGANGIDQKGHMMLNGTCSFVWNTQYGISIGASGSLLAGNTAVLVCSKNGSGIAVQSSSSFASGGSASVTCQNNTNYGIITITGSGVSISGFRGGSNGTNDVWAGYGSIVNLATGANNGSFTCSPAVNTNGNYNSFISNA